MSDSQQEPWSDNPNAPKISYNMYSVEKLHFAGDFISWILYGVIIVLFSRCMAALVNPIHRRGEPIKWGLVSYTAVMFSVVTIQTGMNLDIQSLRYIDGREFPGFEDMPPGPEGYLDSIYSTVLNATPNAMLDLNIWLADGLLLYRCYVIFSKNFWAIALPCLLYLGTLVTGIRDVYMGAIVGYHAGWYTAEFVSFSVLFNIVVTLMIIIRLILHARDTHIALGITGIGGLCKAIVTMLIESCALYTTSSLLVVGTWGIQIGTLGFFLPIFSQVQVITPLLVIQRVANKSALTSNTVVSGQIIELKVRTRGELTGGDAALPDEDLASSVGERGMDPGELEVAVETTISFHWDKAS